MFEAIENTSETVSPEAIEHINNVFHTAKQLKAERAALIEEEKNKRNGTRLESRSIMGFQVKGFGESHDKYKANLKTLEVDSIESNEMHVFVINEQKTALENRLSDLASYKEGLEVELQELKQADALLQCKSQDYAEKLASGDIVGADLIENNRKSQLQENNSQQQEISGKIEGCKKAESLIVADISIYAEIEKISCHNLLLLQYNAIKTPIFEQLEAAKETYENLNTIAHKLWGDNYDRWEHICKLQDFIRDGKNTTLKRGFIESIVFSF
ncbi:hypothetical protein [Thiothrix nivea]|uniref:Uncharacterized protein n=1 Tax=Thiothrix nivea (strain ATCC 35100 / DSM 5205 / JP2) TaxID=870187 RepID=A0A656HBM5_THINJ|nr:hypothetical protein [Thiothrix nivea]EIJ33374.1 hypothetical protein Thini_0737 [Thiothrix nivea DSM 5205]